jgi:hypothetical protein
MQKALKLDGPMRALAISLGGAVVMAIIAMLIPVSIFETITGATGISELVPATAAPLGDTARALIAFLFAAGTFAGLAAIFLRQPVKQSAARPVAAAPVVSDKAEPSGAEPSILATLRQKVADFMESRRAGPVVTELSDLPKLRASDAHPDAPPRRPISATRDLGEVDATVGLPITPTGEQLADITPEPVVPEALPIAVAVQAPTVAEPVPEVEPEPEPMSEPEPTAIATPVADFESVNSMVDRLETALAKRQLQLERLETLATSQPAIAAPALADVAYAPLKPTFAEPSTSETPSPPPLEVVPTETPVSAQASGANEDMDEALRSALETLQRMNARSR